MRINPYELHIRDSEMWSTIYPGNSKRTDRWEWSARFFGNSTGINGTVPHDLHKLRRAPIEHFMSKKAIRSLEPVIQNHMDHMLSRVREYRDAKKVLNLHHLYGCLSADVISDYAFGSPYGMLDSPDLCPNWVQLWNDSVQLGASLKQWKYMGPIMTAIPLWLASLLDPRLKLVANMFKVCRLPKYSLPYLTRYA